MAGVELSADALAGFEFDHRGLRYPYAPTVSWPTPIEHHSSRPPAHRSPVVKRSTSPLEHCTQNHGYEQTSHRPPQPLLLNPDWPMPDANQFAFPLDNSFPQHYQNSFTVPYQLSPADYMSQQAPISHGLQMDGSYIPVEGHLDSMPFDWQDFQQDLMGFPTNNGLPDINMPRHNLPESSPTDTYLEVRSTGSDNGWATIDYQTQGLDISHDPQAAQAIFNPEQTLHNRKWSDSSYSDLEQQSGQSWSSGYVEVSNAISSPGTDSLGDADSHHDHFQCQDCSQHEDERLDRLQRPAIVTSVSKPIKIKKSSSPLRSPNSSGRGSPPTRRQSRKLGNTKATKAIARKPSQAPKLDTEKRIGRRKGPLRPEQRKQAGEIRKLGACLRCKFLKKTVSTIVWISLYVC